MKKYSLKLKIVLNFLEKKFNIKINKLKIFTNRI